MENESKGLLSIEALTFLKSTNYKDRTHYERMALIKLARELYPNYEDEDED